MSLILCNLRVLMAKHGLNIQKVKDKTTLSRTTISNLYNNYGTGIQFDTLKQLCHLLKCQPGDLFTYVDFDIEFRIITESPKFDRTDTIHSKYNEDGTYENFSYISTELDINCKLMYEGDACEFNFHIKLKYELNEDLVEEKYFDKVNIIVSQHLDFKLRELKLDPQIEAYVRSELDKFIIEWEKKYFSDDGVPWYM